mmetsp:Transcript_8521/g.22470  ORF Transcript_8521/g.22470 Transcript_8521/m.22470 type:complete len:312 (+) Transcript_8521:523-1458(+)
MFFISSSTLVSSYSCSFIIASTSSRDSMLSSACLVISVFTPVMYFCASSLSNLNFSMASQISWRVSDEMLPLGLPAIVFATAVRAPICTSRRDVGDAPVEYSSCVSGRALMNLSVLSGSSAHTISGRPTSPNLVSSATRSSLKLCSRPSSSSALSMLSGLPSLFSSRVALSAHSASERDGKPHCAARCGCGGFLEPFGGGFGGFGLLILWIDSINFIAFSSLFRYARRYRAQSSRDGWPFLDATSTMFCSACRKLITGSACHSILPSTFPNSSSSPSTSHRSGVPNDRRITVPTCTKKLTTASALRLNLYR